MRCSSMRLVVVALVALSATAQAQSSCPTDFLKRLPAGDAAWCAVDTAPSIVRNPAPRFPGILASANVDGDVEIEATIGVDGRFDMTSFIVVSATHDLFVRAVLAAIPVWRFEPARLRGASARARGVFHFAFATPLVGNVVAQRPLEAKLSTHGAELFIGWGAARVDPNTPIDTATLYAVVEAVARYFPATDSAQPRCLALGDDRIDPPSTLFASLRARGVDLMPPSRCPRSYASMIATVDARGRPINSAPPGHIEPQRIAIRELRPWAEDVITMSASTSVGLGSTSGQCAAVLEAVNKWVVGCSSLRHTVH